MVVYDDATVVTMVIVSHNPHDTITVAQGCDYDFMYFLENKLMHLSLKSASLYVPVFQYAPIFEQLSASVTCKCVISANIFCPQKWPTNKNVGNSICYQLCTYFSTPIYSAHQIFYLL